MLRGERLLQRLHGGHDGHTVSRWLIPAPMLASSRAKSPLWLAAPGPRACRAAAAPGSRACAWPPRACAGRRTARVRPWAWPVREPHRRGSPRARGASARAEPGPARTGGYRDERRLTAARTALISASAWVATATSGARPAADLGALSAEVGFSTLQPLTSSAATPTVPTISDRLEVTSPGSIAPPEEGKSATERILGCDVSRWSANVGGRVRVDSPQQHSRGGLEP